MDLDEVLAFAAASWLLRKYPGSTMYSDPEMSVYELFRRSFNTELYVDGAKTPRHYQNIFQWLHSRTVPTKLKVKNEKLNPFGGKDLRTRLEKSDPETVQKLRFQLQEDPNEYVFEAGYHDVKRRRSGDNHKLVVMTFQPVFPKRDVIAPSYATEIVRTLRNYPRELAPLAAQQLSLL
ncbi:MAG: hypothetical protein HYS80_00490 [Candidatus Aenigmarchaeota archaeon]|nr:hypothetical protein [Candidatus Aenigmarchaeota archaeon]